MLLSWLTQTVSAQMLRVKKEKVIKVIICLHLEVMLQCQRAELSSLPDEEQGSFALEL